MKKAPLYLEKPRKNNGQFKTKMSKIARRTIIIVSVIILGTLLYKLVNIVQPTEPLVIVQAHNVKFYVETDKAPVTMYTSRVEETDLSPCTSADGSDICKLYATGKNICASNDYPFGTLLTVPGLGDCVVKDRLNRRYNKTGAVDWYAGIDLKRAISYGKQFVEVKRYVLSD